MRLTRLTVTAYGPLAGVDEADLHPVQLVRGPNESGKTLLTEALLRLMTGESPAGARVGDDVVGFVELSDDTGVYRVDADTSLLAQYEERYGVAVTPAEFRNLFVVRDADLPVEGERFYERVTDRLTGLRSDDIRTIMAAVRDRGRLTTKGLRLSDAQPHGKPESQRDDARVLLEAVRRYRRTAAEAGLDAAERERLEAGRERDQLATEVDELEAAEQLATIESLRETVEALREALATRQALPDADTVAKLRRQVTDHLEAAVADTELVARKAHARSLSLGSLAVAVLTFLVFAGLSLPGFAAIVPVLALALAGYFARQWRAASQLATAQARERAALRRSAREVGLDVEDVDELVAALATVERERSAATTAIDQAIGELRGTLDLKDADPETVAEVATQHLDEWANDVPAVDRTFDPAALAAARSRLEDARQTVGRLEAELDEHRRRLERFADRAARLDFATFTGQPLDQPITNLESLRSLEHRLERFVEAIERDADVARVAHGVLETMAETEGEKVTDLFGPDSRTSELFAKVTGGRYEAVRYDTEADEVVVERTGRGGRTQRELSRGTRDQLFFCVRVALAERLLRGARGVFVLDDAFLTADPARLDRQAGVVSTLAEAGWQVLYLTAKPDATAAFEPLCPAPIDLEPL